MGDGRAADCCWGLQTQSGGLEEENLVLCSSVCVGSSVGSGLFTMKFTSESVATHKRISVELYVVP